MNKTLFTLFLLLQVLHSVSQRTGTYDTTFSIASSPFNNTNRKFSVKVDTFYTSSKKYPLVIGLHELGGISNFIIEDNGFLIDSIGAILVCPDGMESTQSRHDNQYSGNEIKIIDEAIDFAKRNYNIDTNSIYIIGFSYGAREALYYGLSHKNTFRGIISVSTGYQSLNDADNNLAMPWAKPFNYSNGKEIPTCFCVGTADATFYPFVKKGYQNMIDSGAKVHLIENTGVGHTPSYPNYKNDVMSCLKFINQNKNTYPPIADFKDQKITTNKDSIYATNISTGNISQYQWYIKKSNTKTNLDTGIGNNHDLKFKLNTINSFDSLCLEVSNTTAQKSTKCKLLKLISASISNSYEDNFISIFPNPTKGAIKIEFNLDIKENFSISIVDIKGRRILSLDKKDYSIKEQSIQIDLTDKLKKGVYFIQINSLTKSFNKQLAIE